MSDTKITDVDSPPVPPQSSRPRSRRRQKRRRAPASALVVVGSPSSLVVWLATVTSAFSVVAVALPSPSWTRRVPALSPSALLALLVHSPSVPRSRGRWSGFASALQKQNLDFMSNGYASFFGDGDQQAQNRDRDVFEEILSNDVTIGIDIDDLADLADFSENANFQLVPLPQVTVESRETRVEEEVPPTPPPVREEEIYFLQTERYDLGGGGGIAIAATGASFASMDGGDGGGNDVGASLKDDILRVVRASEGGNSSEITEYGGDALRVPFPKNTGAKSTVIMFIGDDGGTDGKRAAFSPYWRRQIDVVGDKNSGFKPGGWESFDEADSRVTSSLNLRVQHRYFLFDVGDGPNKKSKQSYTTVSDEGGADIEGGGLSKFVLASAFEGIDHDDPVADFAADRFRFDRGLFGLGGGRQRLDVALAPAVEAVDGGAVLALFVMEGSSSVAISAVTPPEGYESFRMLGSARTASGLHVSAFVSASRKGGGCTGPISGLAERSTFDDGDGVVSGIVMTIALRPHGGIVERNRPVPCSPKAQWNETLRDEIRLTERPELENFYRKTNGKMWIGKGGWLKKRMDHCFWEGIECYDQGLVSTISLPDNNLTGTLPTMRGFQYLQRLNLGSNELTSDYREIGIQDMPAIKHIDLAKNKLSGTLEEVAESLTHLNLSNNLLTGVVSLGADKNNLMHLNLAKNLIESVDVARLVSLQHLDLSGNPNLVHPLAELGLGRLSALTTLNLAKTRLSGDVRIGHLKNLKYLNLNGVGLSGNMESTGITNLKKLSHCDLGGGNAFVGRFDLCASSALEVIDLGGNKLSGSFNDPACRGLTALRYVDLSNSDGFEGSLTGMIGRMNHLEHLDIRGNKFNGQLDDLVSLENLSYVNIAGNEFTGSLPNTFPNKVAYLNVSRNFFTGTIPESITELSVLTHMDLSNQIQDNYDPKTGIRTISGLFGPIPEDIGLLGFMGTMVLSNNLLSGTIPNKIAAAGRLKYIDLENNQIRGKIPSSLDFLQNLRTLLLANNDLIGKIPDLGEGRDKLIVTLKGNADLDYPSPFSMCDLDYLDLRQNQLYCPYERSALAKLYSECKGPEWLVSTKWLTLADHCDWYGVMCNEERTKVVNITLGTNGLRCELPQEFFNLPNLEVLDLNDNILRGSIPTEIGNMKSLKFLRLSYNRFTSLPKEMEQLKNLSLVHLHANKLTGDDSYITLLDSPVPFVYHEHRFITDCGDPQDSASPFRCDGCDMCCNALEECQEPVDKDFEGFALAGVFIGCIFFCLVILYLIIHILALLNILPPPRFSAIDAAGDGSVYSFALSDRKMGWALAVLTMLIQLSVFSLFLNASDFSNDDGDLVYSWRCPRNSEECYDEKAIGYKGWIVFSFVVFAALFSDLANGIKLLVLSAARGSARCFVGGASMFCVTILAVYTSIVFNQALALTDTELIYNAVILLFINALDEQMFEIAKTVNPKWLKCVLKEANAFSTDLNKKYAAQASERSGDITGESNGDEEMTVDKFVDRDEKNSYEPSGRYPGKIIESNACGSRRSILTGDFSVPIDKGDGRGDSTPASEQTPGWRWNALFSTPADPVDELRREVQVLQDQAAAFQKQAAELQRKIQ